MPTKGAVTESTNTYQKIVSRFSKLTPTTEIIDHIRAFQSGYSQRL